MAYNMTSYNANKFSFGPAVLYLVGLTAGGVSSVVDPTDFAQVGGVRSGGTFAVTRGRLDVNQGSPATLVKTFVTTEEVTVSMNGIEWDLSNLALALGAGVVDEGAQPQTFEFGGDLNLSEVAVKLVHEMPSGYTLTIRVWRAQGNGEVNVTFGDDLHEIPYTFRALVASNAWGGAALASNKQLFKMSLATA